MKAGFSRFFVALVVMMTVSSAFAATTQNKPKGGKAEKPTGLATVVAPETATEIFVILEKGTRIADMETRAMAVLTIGKVKPEIIKEYVIDALKDPQWVVRRAAIQALIELKNPEYRKTLAVAVANPALYENKDLSPLALVLQLEPKEAIELLKEALTKAEGVRDLILGEIFRKESVFAKQYYEALRSVPAVKSWVMAHLDVFKDPVMYPLLVKTIPEFSKEELMTVLKFLEGLDNTYDVAFLVPYLKNKDVELQEEAAFILANRGDKRGVDIMLPLCDENELPRQLRCLGAIRGMPNSEEVKERAKLFLFGDPDPQVLNAVYDLFTRAGDESIYERMIARLSSTNLGYRTASVRYLPKIRGTRALPELHGLLKDGAPAIRREAAVALGELRQVESVPHMAESLRNENDIEVRKALIESLGNVADISIVQSVSYLIFDPALADLAVQALAKVTHPTVIQTLRNCLQNRFNTPTRVLALKAIIRISPAEGFPIFRNCVGWLPAGFLTEMAKEHKGQFVEYLREAMKSMNEETRKEAILAFRYAGADVEIKILETELFQAKDVKLKATILERLAEIKGAAALPVLEAFFVDPAKELRLAAIRLSAKLAVPGGSTVDKLRTLMMDADETYRIHAAVALTSIYMANPAPKK